MAELLLPEEIKKKTLPKFERWFDAANEGGYDDVAIQETIHERTRQLEDELQFRFAPVQIVTAPDGTYDVNNSLDVVIEDGYPFFRQGDGYLSVRLHNRPVLSVQRMRLMLNGRQLVFTAPPEWHSFNSTSGKFWLLPLLTSGSFQGASGALASLQVDFYRTRVLPNFIFPDYIAGLSESQWNSQQWAQARRGVREYCALGVLETLAHVVNPGRNRINMNVDGASQTIDYTRFEDRKAELERNHEKFVADFTRLHTPLLMDVV